MRTLAALPALLAMLAGCGLLPTAGAAPATTPPANTAADPACTSGDMDSLLSGVDRAHDRGAFDKPPRADLDPDDVSDWHYLLRRLETAAGTELAGQLAKTREAASKWLDSEGEQREVQLTLIEVTAGTIAYSCRVHEKYGFAGEG